MVFSRVLADTITHPRPVQEAPLAGRGAHFLPAPSPLRQALRGAERARRRDRRAHPAARRRQPGDGGRRRGDDAHPAPAARAEEVPVQISRLLHAHEIILKEAHSMAGQADEAGDDGTNDLLVSDVIRPNELQVWFLSQHVVDVPLVRAD